MRILVLGSTGMLGHKMVEHLRSKFDSVIGVSRPSFDAADLTSVRKVIEFLHPDVVLNCVGVIKQREQDPVLLEAVNAELPHALQKMSPYLIHFSTDCVFSGTGVILRRIKRTNYGLYTENDTPDPVDDYGRTKLKGEVIADNTLTIRTSIIGRELNNYKGLLEWFLRQKGEVTGYGNHIFSGVTTNWLADTVAELLKREQRLTGLYHVAAEPVSKCDLLRMFQKTYNKDDVEIMDKPTARCDRSLDSKKFVETTGIKPIDLGSMLYWTKRADDEGLNNYDIRK